MEDGTLRVLNGEQCVTMYAKALLPGKAVLSCWLVGSVQEAHPQDLAVTVWPEPIEASKACCCCGEGDPTEIVCSPSRDQCSTAADCLCPTPGGRCRVQSLCP